MNAETENSEEPPNSDSMGLETRHVFIDTAVYHRYQYDLGAKIFVALADKIETGVFCLHTTDITLLEIERHLRERAEEISQDVSKADKKIQSWFRSFGGVTKLELPKFDAVSFAETAFSRFRYKLNGVWGASTHSASELKPARVIEKYFQRAPPFDDTKSKQEFPDAFVVDVLDGWCRRNEARMYVVSPDHAMRRAAEATDTLKPIKNLYDLLQLAVEIEAPEVIGIVSEAIEDNDDFMDELNEMLRRDFDDGMLHYSGDWADGEVVESELVWSPTIIDYSVISASPESIGVLLTLGVSLEVHVDHEDRTYASYDREDDIYIGAERITSSFEEEVTLRVLVTFDRDGMDISDFEIITPGVRVSEPYETYK